MFLSFPESIKAAIAPESIAFKLSINITMAASSNVVSISSRLDKDDERCEVHTKWRHLAYISVTELHRVSLELNIITSNRSEVLDAIINVGSLFFYMVPSFQFIYLLNRTSWFINLFRFQKQEIFGRTLPRMSWLRCPQTVAFSILIFSPHNLSTTDRRQCHRSESE